MKTTLVYRKGQGLIETEAKVPKSKAPPKAKEDGGKAVEHREVSETMKPQEPLADSRERPAPIQATPDASAEIERLATELNKLLAEKAERKRKHNERIQRYRQGKKASKP